ncbi:MAG: hypothetical protein MI861_02820 [Pirellulales bacterium]|nr:hypothetical protein [Pirellulales bacterium]
MNRLLLIGSLAGLLIATTGCLHHNTRGGCASGGCASGGCASGNCGAGCNSGACGGRGVLGRLGSACGCGVGGCRNGCVAGPIGWQQGGHDYSSHLQPGVFGYGARANLNSRPFVPGSPTAQIGYPYYTVRGPRDFLLNNPPSIGR